MSVCTRSFVYSAVSLFPNLFLFLRYTFTPTSVLSSSVAPIYLRWGAVNSLHLPIRATV